MPLPGFYKKALLAGAFFILFAFSQVVLALCTSDRYDENVVIKSIHDGDTVTLIDGRKLRLIGINTPELESDRSVEEPYAKEAKDYLVQRFSQSRQWRVRWGQQRHDKYGRWLAHAFIGNDNLNAELLKEGLASVIAIPPNQWALSCYQEQERQARHEARGVWGRRGYTLLQADTIPETTDGFQFVQGRVSKVVTTKKSLWLELSPHFSIRIAHDDLEYFKQHRPEHWEKKKIEVRGWVNSHKGRLNMRIKHPAAIQIID